MPGRRKRFDALLAEHKNRARERERERELHQPHSQQNPALRDPHLPTHLTAAHETYQVTHGNGLAPEATKPLSLSKPKFHSSNLPRYVLLQIAYLFFSAYSLTWQNRLNYLNNSIHLTPGSTAVMEQVPQEMLRLSTSHHITSKPRLMGLLATPVTRERMRSGKTLLTNWTVTIQVITLDR